MRMGATRGECAHIEAIAIAHQRVVQQVAIDLHGRSVSQSIPQVPQRRFLCQQQQQDQKQEGHPIGGDNDVDCIPGV